MAEDLILLDFWSSPFGIRVRVALKEKEVKYEYREEDLGNKSRLLLEMNPVYEKIPVLIHNGRPLSESSIIVQYIDEVWPGKSSLLPKEPRERANARFWADYVDKKAYQASLTVLQTSGEAQEAAKNELINCFRILEGELRDKTYFGGEEFGLVDVSLIPFYGWWYALEKMASGLCFKEECPKLVEWGERCMERQSVSESLPDQRKLYEYILKLQNQPHH